VGRDEPLTFSTEGSLAGSTEMDFLGKGTPVQVNAERLKDRLANQHVDFLKIDIEGAQNEVLFDIVDELANVDHLFFEYHSIAGKPQRLGGVDEFEPVSGSGDVNHAHEAFGELVVPRCDGAVDLQSAEHALDAVALLVERSVMIDLHAAV